MDKLEEKSEERKEWSKSIMVNGVTKSLRVEELDNGGYLICYSKYGTDPETGKYIDTPSKKYYSTKNPLEKEEPKKEESSELADIMDFITDKTQLL